MRRFVCLRRNNWKSYVVLASLGLAAAGREVGAQQPSDDAVLLLAVVVNGRPINLVGDFKKHGGALYATPTELDTLGFKVRLKSPDGDVLLSTLPGVSYRFDEKTQTLYFTATNAALKPTLIGGGFVSTTRDLPVESGLGAAINYDVVGTMAAGRTVAEGLADVRVFSPWGVFTSSSIATSGSQYGTQPLVRLDSTFSYSDPDTLRRYRVGDVISSGLAWTRPVRLGGVQITTDFSIRPDLVTFPVPTITGTVAVPSSVDVLVNGVQLLSRDLPPGPFEIRQLPVINGAGDVSVVIHNEVGQQVTQTLPTYASSLLLARGLTAFSAEMGTVRLNYGVDSQDYRAPAASFSVRHGLLDWLTLEAHGEGNGPYGGRSSSKTVAGGMAGGGAAVTMGHWGVISVAAAASNYGRHRGGLASASYERVTPVLSFAVSVQASSRKFGDLAAASGQPVPRLQTRASIGLALGRFGSLGVAYVGVRQSASRVAPGNQYAEQPVNAASGFGIVPLLPATKVDLVSVSYSRPVFNQRASLYATAYHDFSHAGSSGLLIGLTIPLGRRSNAGVSAGTGTSGTGGTLQASQSADDVGDVGWRVQEDAGQPARQMAEAGYKSPWGTVGGGIDRIAGQTAYRATAQGSLAYAGGGLFAANTINDSFAVVDTDGAAGVQVLQENRPVGRTGSSGLLLVPDLRSFDANRIAIDPTDVPLDADMGQTTRMVRPQDHSGVVVRFPVHVSHGALLQMVDKTGAAIPVGSTARLAAAPELVVGYGGELYVSGLQPHNAVQVKLPNGRLCTATFDYKTVTGTLPIIGPLLCKDAM